MDKKKRGTRVQISVSFVVPPTTGQPLDIFLAPLDEECEKKWVYVGSIVCDSGKNDYTFVETLPYSTWGDVIVRRVAQPARITTQAETVWLL